MYFSFRPESLEALGLDSDSLQAIEAWQATLTGKNSSVGNSPKFWIVIRLHKKNFSENLEFQEYPRNKTMMIPASGTGEFAGIGMNALEVSEIISKDPDNYVHLTYEVETGGNKWRKLIELCVENGLLGTHGTP
jgi:hypothetical protein